MSDQNIDQQCRHSAVRCGVQVDSWQIEDCEQQHSCVLSVSSSRNIEADFSSDLSTGSLLLASSYLSSQSSKSDKLV